MVLEATLRAWLSSTKGRPGPASKHTNMVSWPTPPAGRTRATGTRPAGSGSGQAARGQGQAQAPQPWPLPAPTHLDWQYSWLQTGAIGRAGPTPACRLRRRCPALTWAGRCAPTRPHGPADKTWPVARAGAGWGKGRHEPGGQTVPIQGRHKQPAQAPAPMRPQHSRAHLPGGFIGRRPQPLLLLTLARRPTAASGPLTGSPHSAGSFRNWKQDSTRHAADAQRRCEGAKPRAHACSGEPAAALHDVEHHQLAWKHCCAQRSEAAKRWRGAERRSRARNTMKNALAAAATRRTRMHALAARFTCGLPGTPSSPHTSPQARP
jgi:hypothetical protein